MKKKCPHQHACFYNYKQAAPLPLAIVVLCVHNHVLLGARFKQSVNILLVSMHPACLEHL